MDAQRAVRGTVAVGSLRFYDRGTHPPIVATQAGAGPMPDDRIVAVSMRTLGGTHRQQTLHADHWSWWIECSSKGRNQSLPIFGVKQTMVLKSTGTSLARAAPSSPAFERIAMQPGLRLNVRRAGHLGFHLVFGSGGVFVCLCGTDHCEY
jgi:hypothetical protein